MSTVQNISPAQIKDQVAILLKSPEFKRSRILSDFLKFIVRETLEGNENNLKEYVIATEVLHKSSDFNPQLDAVVRIHAGRLRNLLEHYYQDEGKNDPLKISMPKGRYIPVFESTGDAHSVVSASVKDEIDLHIESIPTIAVLPFDCLSDSSDGKVICSVLSRDLTIALSYFNELKVISNHAAAYAKDNLKNWKEIVSHLGAEYIITGACLREEGNLKVNIELHHNKENQVIWAESLLIEDYKENELQSYHSIVKMVVAKICGFVGVIYRSKLTTQIPQDYDTLYAIYWHNKFHQNFSIEALQESSKAIDKALVVKPEMSILNALKAELILNLCAMDVQGDEDYFRDGTSLVSRAVALDQKNQHAWQVLAWSKLLAKNKSEYDHAAEKCISINPFNSHFLGSIGFGYQCSGDYEKGLELMLDAIDLSPYYPWQINMGLCLYYLHKNDFDEARYWSKLIKRPGLLWDPLLQISALGLMNKAQEASHLIDDLFKLSPDFQERATIIVGRFIIDQELQNSILRGLTLAGISIKLNS